MISQIPLDKTLFIDIETVTECENYEALSDIRMDFWDKKSATFAGTISPSESYITKGAIFAEFSKIVCISVGYLVSKNNTLQIRLKSFSDHDEVQLLQDFAEFIYKLEKLKKHTQICGHNIKEFDLPFICRRMLVNGISLPDMIDYSSKKPWETNALDTLHMWRFGDYKHYTSLALLCEIFGIKTPKSEMDGSKVGEVYYQEKDLNKISMYCQNDVISVIQLVRKMQGREQIDEDNIEAIIS
jgi:3'-5' exonuclease